MKSLALHKKLRGKIVVSSKVPLDSKDVFSLLYTPGVGDVSQAIAKQNDLVWEYTGRGNTVAIISDGSAVLGLGNIGPEAALPVMEGKAVLFAQFGGINAFPLCVKVNSSGELVQFVKSLSPSFGGINLEDIAAPACFEVEEKLQTLGIPVFHDDQDGSAIAIIAGLINACKVTKKRMNELKVVILGAGAAASATAWLLLGLEKWQTERKINKLPFEVPKDIIIVDRKGILNKQRSDLSKWKKMLANTTNKANVSGGLDEALDKADVLIGLSSGGKVRTSQIRQMNKSPIIFVLSNPTPEIMPLEAKKSGASIVATGRSDFPNQVNNALVFPGFFRGLLDSRATSVSSRAKIAAVDVLASSLSPTVNKILPDILNKSVHHRISEAVENEEVEISRGSKPNNPRG